MSCVTENSSNNVSVLEKVTKVVFPCQLDDVSIFKVTKQFIKIG